MANRPASPADDCDADESQLGENDCIDAAALGHEQEHDRPANSKGILMTDRRRFLQALGAAGAAALVPSTGLFGQERVVKLNVRSGAVDVHHHFVPPGGTTNRP
jgi:hypothetical protein